MSDSTGDKCGARRRQGGGTCGLPAGWGTDHVGYGPCRKHLGNAPRVALGALRKHLDARAAAELARLDVAPVADPLSELARLAGQVVAWKDRMAGKVNELTELRYSGQLGTEQIRSELLLWERALDRCVHVLTAMAKLNIDERLAAIEERKAEMVAAAVREGLARSGASPVQQEEAKRHVVTVLRAIPA